MHEESQEEYRLEGEDLRVVESLSDEEIEKIDIWLLENITNNWQKVAMVVAKAIEESDRENELTFSG